jgi:hypothetical protein
MLPREFPDSEMPVDSGIWEENMAAREADMRFYWDRSYEREFASALKERLGVLYAGVVRDVSVQVSGGEIREVRVVIENGRKGVAEAVRTQIVQWLPVNVGLVKVETETETETEAAGTEAAGNEAAGTEAADSGGVEMKAAGTENTGAVGWEEAR